MKTVRDIENAAAARKFELELNAVVDHTKRDIETEATKHILDNASQLADYAQNVATDELKTKMASRIIEAWTDAQTDRLRNK